MIEPGAQYAILNLSGGIDSACCCDILLKQKFSVSGIFFDYGQAANQLEWSAAQRVASHYAIPIKKLDVGKAQHFSVGEIRGRNALFALASLMFEPIPRALIVQGIHSGTDYYDCSVQFAQRIDQLINEMTDGRCRFHAPLLNWRKAEVYSYALSSYIPIEKTYSCQAGTQQPCGECRSCQDRSKLGV